MYYKKPMNKISIEKSKNLKPKPNSSNLGFGKYFTDHIFLSHFSKAKNWHNHQIIPYSNLSIDPGASALHYGQALFEGLKAFKQNDGTTILFRPEFNWKRMAMGAERLCMQVPPKDLFIDGIKQLIKLDESWIPENEGSSLYIRPTLIGTEGFLGVRPAEEYLFFVILSPVGPYYGPGSDRVKIWIEEKYTRAVVGGLGATKAAANYASSLKAALEAKRKDFSQVLWLDASKKYIEEVGTMNVFFVFENEIVTPELDGTILGGGTREVVIHLLQEKEKKGGKKVVERKLSLEEVVQASQKGQLLEAFGTGTAAVISPISELANEHLQCQMKGPDKIATELKNEIVSIQKGLAPDRYHWLDKI
jgi:branched-chain amino acid aminotransferase